MESIYSKLDHIIWRLRCIKAIEAGSFLLLINLIACCGIIIVSKFLILPISTILLCSLLIGSSSILVILYGLTRPVTRLQAAQVADSQSNLQERISTALEFSDQIDSPFVKPLLEDAIQSAELVDPKAVSPFLMPKNVKYIAGLSLLFMGFNFLPDFDILKPKIDPRTIEIIHKEAEVIEKHAEELKSEAKAENLETVRQAAEEMRKIAHQLQNKKISKKEALKKLSGLEQQIAEKKKVDQKWDRNDLKAAVQKLEKVQKAKNADQNEQNLESQKARELAKVKKRLEELSERLHNNELNDEEQTDVSEALENMSQSLEKMELNDAAENLAEAADDLDQDDQKGAAEDVDDAIENLSEAVNSAEQQLAENKALQEAAQQVQQSKQNIAEASQQMESVEGIAQNFDSGNGSQQQGEAGQQGEQSGQQNSGSQQGGDQNQSQSGQEQQQQNGDQGQESQGRHQTTVRAGSGRDWGTESTNLDQGSSQEVEPTSDSQNRQANSGDMRIEAYHRLYDPRTSGGQTEGTKISGRLGDGKFAGQTEVSTTPIGETADAPVYEMYLKYQEAAEEALNQSEIPRGYQRFVKDYFESIKPKE